MCDTEIAADVPLLVPIGATGRTDTGMTDTGRADIGMTGTGRTDTGRTDTGKRKVSFLCCISLSPIEVCHARVL